MTRAFVAVGSNIEPERNVERGLGRLARSVRVDRLSTFYRTSPVDGRRSPPFINGMVELTTELDPLMLKLTVLRAIESELGRQRTGDKYADRTLDLDLVLYGDLVSSSPELVLPDPELAQRPFLAFPLLELDPELRLPGSRVPLHQLVVALGSSDLQPLMEYTERLRRSIAYG
jgi:dihydroneopterin aldolase/2-amino-4-hydroxy-6-hydroxymethyldihydropteridine diphosphokinase